MHKFSIATFISVFVLGPTPGALAAGQSGGVSRSGDGSSVVANFNITRSADQNFGKDRAANRAVSKSTTPLNSNGIKSSDRDRGLARAADRRHRAHRKTQPRK